MVKSTFRKLGGCLKPHPYREDAMLPAEWCILLIKSIQRLNGTKLKPFRMR